MRENPIPGMNPWLEQFWGDVHTSLTTYARDQLNQHLPTGLRARIEEYVAAIKTSDSGDRDESRFAPDVRVVERPFTAPAGQATAVADPPVALADPVVVTRQVEPETLHSISIIEKGSGDRVVTSIEFISPANKVGEAGRTKFREKQDTMLEGGVNVVELDFIRSGKWVVSADPEKVPQTHQHPYRICIVRANQQAKAEFYQASFRSPLPSIRIPLRPGDDDVNLELQPLIDQAYLNGCYGEDIDYSREPDPSLSPNDTTWMEAWLKDRGLR